jgi:hypothetical protein
MYGVECTSPKKRGMLMSLYNIGLPWATLPLWQCVQVHRISRTIGRGRPHHLSDSSGRHLCHRYHDISRITSWLLTKGKEEKHGSHSVNSTKGSQLDEITAQIREVQSYIEFEKPPAPLHLDGDLPPKRHPPNVHLCFDFYRVTITGIQFVIPYAAIFLSGVGIQNPYLINVIIGLCIFAGTFPTLHRRVRGRRFAMLAGYGVCHSAC